MKKKLRLNKKKFIPVSKPHISSVDISSVNRVLKKNWISSDGPEVTLFEKKFSNKINRKFSIAVSNGTAALEIAVKALKIKKGDEVIMPNFTIISNALSVIKQNAKPVLVDCDLKTWNMKIEDIKKKINKKTKAIIAVHISGRGSNIIKLKQISKKYKIKLIEDAAEAFASKYNNKSLGTFGEIGCFSFSPPKIFTTGQGGAIVTNNLKLYKEIIKLKNQGRIGKSDGGEDTFASIGYNFKFTNLQSALGISQLKNLHWRKKKLIKNYNFYKKNIKESSNFKIFKFNVKKGELPLWTDVFCKKRNQLFNFLIKRGFECRYFWHPINYCKPYKQSFKSLEISKKLHGKLMWLPSSLKLKNSELLKICNLINEFNSKYNG